jgi:superfamily II DNA helicase RecQ
MKDDLEVYCPECNQLFQGEQNMLKHMEKEHSEKQPKHYGTHHCPNCGASYYFGSIEAFKNSMAKPSITCKHCLSTYKMNSISDEAATANLVEIPKIHNEVDSYREKTIEVIEQAEKKKRIIDQYRKIGVPSPEENLNARIIVTIKLEGKTEQQVIDEIYENAVPKVDDYREKMSELASLYADGKIGKEAYATASKTLEDKIGATDSPNSTKTYKTNYNGNQSPSVVWYLLPIFFALLGGIIGYSTFRHEKKSIANNLLFLGIIMSFVYFILVWEVYLSLTSSIQLSFLA